MVVSRSVELFYRRGISKERGRWVGALALVIGRIATPICLEIFS